MKSVTKVRNENDFFRETIFNFALAFFCENSVKTTFFSSIWRFFKFLLERYLCRFSNPVLELFQQRLMKGKTFTQDLCGWKHPFTQRKLSWDEFELGEIVNKQLLYFMLFHLTRTFVKSHCLLMIMLQTDFTKFFLSRSEIFFPEKILSLLKFFKTVYIWVTVVFIPNLSTLFPQYK